MKYRIVVETEASGKNWYYVQYRFFFFFWRYHREVRDISMYAYKIAWHTLEDAKNQIQKDIEHRYSKYLKKIVKRNVLNFNECA